MPKGVEHPVSSPVDPDAPVVPKSEMPKGVEHVSSGGAGDDPSVVPKSEMPKGVEHPPVKAGAVAPAASAEVRDAERR